MARTMVIPVLRCLSALLLASAARPQSTPPAASVTVTVQVPASMRTAPFHVTRSLTVPPGFTASVFARVGGARFLAVAPNGDVLVSQPGAGKVVLLRPSATGGDPQRFDFATGLRRPHDIVFHTIAGTTYAYVAESHQINRYTYQAGQTTAQNRQVVVSGLPDNDTPELQGAYGHELKNIALDPSDRLYVSIASTCNACVSDTVSTPVRGAVYVYTADGRNGRLFARGLRNAEGLAMVPGTGTLWVAVNNRDNIAYPHNDGSGNYGRVTAGYVDNHPPEELTRVRDGGNYGWPFCNPNPDTASGLNDMPFDRDYQLNADGAVDCGAMDRISKGIQAHSAPLGLTFLQNTAFPTAYRQGVVVPLHGSWNRQRRTGYRVAYFPWNASAGQPGNEIDFARGWLDEATQTVWGRPVDAAVDPQGGLLVSDDQSGTLYRFAYETPAPGGQSVTRLSLVNTATGQPVVNGSGQEVLADGSTLNLATLPSGLSIQAFTSPTTVGSVRFGQDGNPAVRDENVPPYALCGDSGSAVSPCTFGEAPHLLTATPYTGQNAGGTAGSARSVTYFVVRDPNGKLLLHDDFEDGNAGGWSTTGGSWSVLQPTGRTLLYANASSYEAVSTTGSVAWADYSVQAAVTLGSGTGEAGVLGRVQSGSRYYQLALTNSGGGQWTLRRRDGATWVTLASGPITVYSNRIHVLKLTMTGPTLAADLSTDQGATFQRVGLANDAGLATGRVGLRSAGVPARFDGVAVRLP